VNIVSNKVRGSTCPVIGVSRQAIPDERMTQQMDSSLMYPDCITSKSLSRENQPPKHKERR
jgi:hypothetical protein